MKNIKSRAEILSQVFKFKLMSESNGSKLQFLDGLINSLEVNSNITSAKKINILWLCFCGIYPSDFEIQNSEFFIICRDWVGLLNLMESNSTYLQNQSENKNIELESANPQMTYVDISHSFDYPYMSGIQRVVWNLSEQLALNKDSYKVQFIRFETKTRSFHKISHEQLLSLAEIKRKIPIIKYKWIKTLLGKEFSWIIGKFKWRIETTAKNIFYFFFKKPKSTTVVMPILEEVSVLIPEVIPEGERLNVWLNILKNLNTKSTMIIYDLIPVYYPEYCEISREFVNYLRLLRHIGQVSCISAAVKDDLDHFIRPIQRQNQLSSRVHYLGADLANQQKLTEFLPNYEITKPLILCVGTIEPRKNHRNIMRAAAQLQMEGVKFQLIFAGNIGWKNDDVMKELANWQAKGIDILLRNSVSDSELKWLYTKTLATIFCSFVEGFGLPIIESNFYAKRCIVSNSGSMREIGAKYSGNIQADPNSVASIKLALSEVLINKGLDSASQKFEWTTWRTYAEEIYEFSR